MCVIIIISNIKFNLFAKLLSCYKCPNNEIIKENFTFLKIEINVKSFHRDSY